VFELHVVQAMYGDSLLLVYGQPDQLHYMLIDGGPAGVYASHLQRVLTHIAVSGGHLDRVVLTHTDDDHVTGLVDFFAEQRSRQIHNELALPPVDGMWMNSFAFDATVAPSMANIVIPLPPPAHLEAAPADPSLPLPAFGVAEGMDLRELLAQLTIPINSGFPNDLVSLETASDTITVGGLKVTMLGPTKSNLDRMGRDWRAWLKKHTAPEGAAAAPDLGKAIAPDQSIPNRSSIMFVAEYDERTVLLTGDGRGSDLVRGLIRRYPKVKDGVFHVNVLKVPHHGSARNVSRQFFSQITADTYVFSADGTNGNPDLPTLGWLVTALKEQRRQATLVFTNPTSTVTELCSEFSPRLYGYKVEVLDHGVDFYPIRLS
jgi:glyoxylase-like metal-dependent hydrolase (beta-lactamase superfamily II)